MKQKVKRGYAHFLNMTNMSSIEIWNFFCGKYMNKTGHYVHFLNSPSQPITSEPKQMHWKTVCVENLQKNVS
jgi:hypothetical protein